MSCILILDDEQVIRNALRRMLERNDFDVLEAGTVDEALEQPLDEVDLIIADIRLPGAEGTELIPKVPDIPVIIMTSYASVRSAVNAMKVGAVDYISKPFDHDEMLLIIERTLKQKRILRQNAALKQDLQRDYPVTGMVGDCQAMRQVLDHINKAAPVDVNVLVTGESGTGKELVARALHEGSNRCESPLIAVNCGAIPEGLIESELFGHEKGSFTGATEKRKGLAEAADGGTLFLDEIGELPLSAQTRLLRLIESGEIRPVGSSYSRRVDIRLVAATHRQLEQLVADGEFRGDLYFRLRVMEVLLPPLRDRGQDILILAQHFLKKACSSMNRSVEGFSEATQKSLLSYSWPGNVRELQNAIERAVILCEGPLINPYDLGLSQQNSPIHAKAQETPLLSLDDYFRHAVTTWQGKMTETELAQRLGISRKALWERRNKMHIPRA